MTSNLRMHRTRYSGLRPLARAGDAGRLGDSETLSLYRPLENDNRP